MLKHVRVYFDADGVIRPHVASYNSVPKAFVFLAGAQASGSEEGVSSANTLSLGHLVPGVQLTINNQGSISPEEELS